MNNKWLSRTYWLIVGVIALASGLLVYRFITDSIWQSIIVIMVGAWVGNDLTAKLKGKNEKL